MAKKQAVRKPTKEKTAQTDDGQRLDSELCYRLFNLPATVTTKDRSAPAGAYLEDARKEEVEQCIQQVDNPKLGRVREKQINEIRRDSQAATTLTEKLAAQKRLKQAESERKTKQRELYDAQDAKNEGPLDFVGDQLKTNKVLEMKSHGIEFRTV